MKSQSTVGAGDSMVGAMTLKLAEGASLEEMVKFGVAAGSAATINQGTNCVPAPTHKKSTITCVISENVPSPYRGASPRLAAVDKSPSPTMLKNSG
jgi:fructose-1-phosphate kinase PfkB-like protein